MVIDRQAGLVCNHFIHHPETGYLCVPLMVQGGTIGLLCLTGAPEQVIGSITRQQLAVAVGDTIKLSFYNLKLREELREQAIHDPLTGLCNRRYLEENLVRELHRAERGNSPLCVVMLDLDNFKPFNDTFGHDAGDSLLRQLGQVLRENLRKSDIACRYGGDEFVLVLPIHRWPMPSDAWNKSHSGQRTEDSARRPTTLMRQRYRPVLPARQTTIPRLRNYSKRRTMPCMPPSRPEVTVSLSTKRTASVKQLSVPLAT